jgi:hypothetical protein
VLSYTEPNNFCEARVSAAAAKYAIGRHSRRQAHYFLNLSIARQKRYREGGARPMKGETEAKDDAALDRGVSAGVSSLVDKDLLFFRQSPGTQRERRTALASLI